MTVSLPEAAPGSRPEEIPFERLGRPITGPTALGTDLARLWALAFNIAVMDWKLRFFGSALGYLWQLVRPLLLFLVLYVFFTKVAHVGGSGPGGEFYGAQLLGSIVLFTFFSESTTAAVRSVVEREALVRKIQFPRLAIPLSTNLLALFNLSLNLIVVTIFAVISGVHPMLTWLEIVPIVALLIVLCFGISMLLSALFVYLRDIQPIWEVVAQVIFYASPIIVPIEKIEEHLHGWLLRLYMFNPLAVATQQFRHAFITHATPSVGALLGSTKWIAVPAAISLLVLGLGFVVFTRIAPKVAEDL